VITVAITTAVERAPSVEAVFAAARLQPVVLPCIRTEVAARQIIADMRERADRADLVVLTSATAVDLLWGDAAPAAPVAAVGSATAHAVTVRGGTVLIVGSSTGRQLAADVDAEGLTVVFPHAHETDPEVVRILSEKAASLLAAPVYRSVPIPPPDNLVDAVAFASPSAVRGWMLSRSLNGLVIGAIGRRTAEQIVAVGGTVHVMPDVPRFDLMAQAFSIEAHV